MNKDRCAKGPCGAGKLKKKTNMIGINKLLLVKFSGYSGGARAHNYSRWHAAQYSGSNDTH